jgi:hypothetical protein
MMVLGITVQRVYMQGKPRCWWIQQHGLALDSETVQETKANFRIACQRERSQAERENR